MSICADCGCKKYNGACTNCHEEIYIEQQYLDEGMPLPRTISEAAQQQREQIKRGQDAQ